METVRFPYGKGYLTADFEEGRLAGVLRSRLEDYVPEAPEEELIRRALECPIGSPRLSELARGKKKVTVIASDHTRPVPSKLIMPALLREIRSGNPDAQITILIATGCHRATDGAELVAKFGPEICVNERIVVHDCDDEANLVTLGVLPSGALLRIDRIAAEADLLVSEGFIEPHFFAGFSGGRKSVLPGVCARRTVMENHCSAFIADPKARTGILDGNPIHRDMQAAARMAGLTFICNVVLNGAHQVLRAFAGAPEEAHRAGCDFVSRYCRVEAVPADIVISTNGGAPLDQNIYQAVKGMTAAEATVREGGVIVMLAASGDGHGGKTFFETFRDGPDLDRLMARFLATPAAETVPDQWQSQIFCRVLRKARVIFVSEAPDETVRALRMIPAHSLPEALCLAEELLGKPAATVTAIPDGVSVMVTASSEEENDGTRQIL